MANISLPAMSSILSEDDEITAAASKSPAVSGNGTNGSGVKAKEKEKVKEKLPLTTAANKAIAVSTASVARRKHRKKAVESVRIFMRS